jgi:hypothetical protein
MYLYLFILCDEDEYETIHLLSPTARERGPEPTISLLSN